MPCGPIPPCADSLMSSSTGLPSAPTPIGTRSRLPRGRSAQLRAMSCWYRSLMPSSEVRSKSVLSGSETSIASPSRYGEIVVA